MEKIMTQLVGLTQLVDDQPQAQAQPQHRLQSKAAAHYLASVHNVAVSMRSLDKWRSTGGGPKFEKLLGRAYYRPEWLDEWVAAKSSGPVTSTSALPA
jgi:hypothetical protein